MTEMFLLLTIRQLFQKGFGLKHLLCAIQHEEKQIWEAAQKLNRSGEIEAVKCCNSRKQ